MFTSGCCPVVLATLQLAIMPVNQEKLKKLQQQGDKSRIGGKVSQPGHHNIFVQNFVGSDGSCQAERETPRGRYCQRHCSHSYDWDQEILTVILLDRIAKRRLTI